MLHPMHSGFSYYLICRPTINQDVKRVAPRKPCVRPQGNPVYTECVFHPALMQSHQSERLLLEQSFCLGGSQCDIWCDGQGISCLLPSFDGWVIRCIEIRSLSSFHVKSLLKRGEHIWLCTSIYKVIHLTWKEVKEHFASTFASSWYWYTVVK